jgi:hypothetical protein
MLFQALVVNFLFEAHGCIQPKYSSSQNITETNFTGLALIP